MPPQKNFSKVPGPSIDAHQRSTFNRSHTNKTTFNTGLIIPVFSDEVLPGDSVDLSIHAFMRLTSTLKFPIMDNIHIKSYSFFVPNRLLWIADLPVDGSWEKFQGFRKNPTDSIDFEVPQVTTINTAPHDLMNYFGVPLGDVAINNNSVCAFYPRAYIKIYNDWFKSEDLQNEVLEITGDGPDADTLYPLQKKLKAHDYFTSCLPFPQKTAIGASIGLTGTAPVLGDGNTLGLVDGTDEFGMFTDNAPDVRDVKFSTLGYDVALGAAVGAGAALGASIGVGVTTTSGESGLIADLSAVNAVFINDLRNAVATQHLLELQARGGTRYVETIKAIFGVTSPDYRLQRAEYLGGAHSYLNVNPVTQTSETDTTEQGFQTAFGTGSHQTSFSKSFTEHGIIMTLLCIDADLTYQQGVPRSLSRLVAADYYTTPFANLGEMAVLNKEIFHDDSAQDDLVFGYQEAWADYRYYPSRISGWFSSDSTLTLDAWHLSQDFAGLPVLGSTFLKEDVPMDRVLAVTGASIPEVIYDSAVTLRHTRVMPTYSVPGLHRL